jgi:hypothetical protein
MTILGPPPFLAVLLARGKLGSGFLEDDLISQFLPPRVCPHLAIR